MIAEIIINSNAKEINRTFDYIVPENLQKNVKIGTRVYVPFGRQKLQEGFIINLKDSSQYANKEIIKVKDNLLDKEEIELAKLMSRRYFCNISDCIKLMLPPGNKTLDIKTKEKQVNYISLKENIDLNSIKSDKQKQVIQYLQKKDDITMTELSQETGVSSDIIKRLEKNNYIEFKLKRVERNPFINKDIQRDKPLQLTEEQKIAYQEIVNSKYNQFLIYGITGSRKNRSLFTINSKYNSKEKNSHCLSA